MNTVLLFFAMIAFAPPSFAGELERRACGAILDHFHYGLEEIDERYCELHTTIRQGRPNFRGDRGIEVKSRMKKGGARHTCVGTLFRNGHVSVEECEIAGRRK